MLQAAEGNAADGAAYPQIINIAFQMAFAMITAAIVTGSLAGRVKFGAMTAFLGIWLLVVYAPLAHMVWGGDGSFIGDIIGALDFAGGDVVHISSGLTGLILCLMLGRRRGFGMVSYRPHNVPFVALGAGLLWFGWFGFNGGSEFKADAVAALAILNTVTASAAGMVSWLAVERVHTGRPTLVGVSTGLVAGLVVVTPGAGFVEPWAALVMGLIVSPVCYLAISILRPSLATTMRSTRSVATASAASWAACSRACSVCRSSRGPVRVACSTRATCRCSSRRFWALW